MKKVKKKSPIPPYGVAALWLIRALTGTLNTLGEVLGCIALSVVVYFVLRKLFPDKEVEVTGEEPAPQPQKAPPKAPETPKEPEKPREQPVPKSTVDPELDEVLRRGREAVAEIRRLNDEIPDFKVSAQLKQLEILTERIFVLLEKNPKNLRQTRQFMNYYLPTTIKLLNQYVTLQEQGMRIGNIDEGMKKIEAMLDKIIVAFQKQLDSLFESDVVDITADIQVMEQMMAAEGLTNETDF